MVRALTARSETSSSVAHRGPNRHLTSCWNPSRPNRPTWEATACTAASMGRTSSVSPDSANPVPAPATAIVATVVGSLPAAPATSPGPSWRRRWSTRLPAFDTAAKVIADSASSLIVFLSAMIIYPEPWPGRLGRLTLDLLAVLWTAAWALAGWTLYRLVLALEVVADSISRTGETFNSWVRTFQNAVPSGVPGIGGAFRGIGDALQRTAGDPLVQRGMQAHTRIEQVAVVLGLSVAIVPIVSVTGAYVVWRWRDASELTAAAEFVRVARRSGRVAEANAVLAHRAVSVLPFRQLMRASPD